MNRTGRARALFASVVAAFGVAAIATAPGAAASPPTPQGTYASPVVEWISPVVHASGDTAVVHAKYKCSGGNVGTHLFIAVKQGPLVNATDHTTSDWADTFYSTNYNSDGPGLSLFCDGRSHNVSFVLEPDPYFAFGHPDAPPLTSGQAFVQFCLFDSTGNEETGFAFDYSMRKVVLNG